MHMHAQIMLNAILRAIKAANEMNKPEATDIAEALSIIYESAEEYSKTLGDDE